MSNVVLEATPEIVLIVDSAFQIIEFNKRAEDVFGINKSEAVNKMIFEIMDASDFEQVLDDHLSIKRKKIHLSGLGLVLLENIIYIDEMDAMLAIFQDITDEEVEMERQLQMRMDTVDIAQQVIDKQMTVAQEIAGLLGETTAETKVILTQLRDSMMKEADQTDNRRRKIEMCIRDRDEINRKLLEQAKVAGDLGGWFGKEGEGLSLIHIYRYRRL